MEDPKPPSPPPTTTRAAAKEAAFVNFRSLVVQFVMASAPNMLSKKDQIEQRIQELVPSCPTPRHPTYKWMIEVAITQLNEERGSNIESISEFIVSEHKDSLPLAHTTLLKHHLKNLCESGFLVVNDDGLYFLGEENNEPVPEPKPNPATDSDPDPSLDYIYESDSTSSSGESFSPIVEMEMIEQCKDKTVGRRIRGKGKNVHCRARSRKKDLLVGIELGQENEADEERPDESQRVVSENHVSRVTGKQDQKRKRGRPRKNITMSSNQTSNPWEEQRSVRKNVIAVAEGTLVEQDEVVADNQNQQNEADEDRPNELQRILGENPVSRVTGQQDQKRKRGRPRKNITTSSNLTSQPREKQRSVRKNVNIAVSEGTLMEQDEVVADNQNQQNEADEERPDESQRILSEHPVSRVTGQRDQKPKRGRPRKNITTSSNLTSKPWEKQCSVRNNVNIAVSEGTLMEQDEVVADNQNQLNEADEERPNESQRILSEHPVSRVTGQQDQKRKRGRPRKNITTSSNLTSKPWEKQCSVRNNVNIAVSEGTLMEQDEVVADNQNQQNEDQEFLPQNEVFLVDSDYTANFTRMEQSDEDMDDLDLLIDHVCMELQAVNATQSFTLEDEVIRSRTEEQHRVHLNKDLINDRCQVEPSTMVTDIVPVEQKCELSMERSESLQKDALMEETGRSMNITEANGIHNLNELTEVENKNNNETIDLVNSNCQAEPNCTVEMDIAPEKQERQVNREGTELLQNDKLMAETRMNAPEARECGEEHNVNEQSLENQACLTDDVEFQERESGGIEVENHVKDACEILKERDEQAITNHPEVYECEVGMERTESLQRDVHVEETAKSMNKTEANEIQDLIEELEFENENHNEPNETIDLANGDSRSEPSTIVINVALEDKEHQVSMEKTESLQNETRNEETEMNVTATKECGKERDTNEQSVGDQTCLMNDVEGRERDSDVIEEKNHLKDACKLFEEKDEQAITEQNHPDEQECGKERDTNEQSVGDQTCFMNDVERHERDSDLIKEKNHLKDACEIFERAITEQNHPDEHEYELIMKRTESSVAKRMMGLEILVEFGGRSCKSMLECEQISASEKMELEGSCSRRTNTLKQRLDTSSVKKSPNVKAVRVVQQVEKRQLRSRSNKAQPIESEAKGSIIVPSHKSSETGQHTEEQKQDLEMHDEYDNLDGPQCALEMERIDAFKRREENEVMNQQLKEHRRDACPSQRLQGDGVNKSKSQQLAEQNQEMEMREEYENLDQARQSLEEEKIYASKEQEKNEDVNQQLNEQQDAVSVGEDKGVAERRTGLEILVKFGGRSRKSMLECEQNSASEKMELEGNCSGRTNPLEQRLDTSSVKKSPKVKTVRVVQQVEKRQLRSRSNKAQLVESEVKGSIIVPSHKSSETGQHTEEQKHDLEMHDEYKNLDGAQCASEKEQIDDSTKQEENEDMNQQLKEHRRDACPSQRLQEDGVNKSKSQQLAEQNQEIEVREEYENLDQSRQSLEEEKIYSSKEQEKNKDVNQQLNEQQDAVNIGEDKGVAERMMGLEILEEFGGRSCKSMLDYEQDSASEKMELEGNCIGRTNALEQRLDTSSVKKSPKVKAVRVVQQVEKRQLRSRSNKAQPIESEVMGSIIVPSHKSSETGQRKKLKVTKQLEQGTRRSSRLQKSRSGN